MYETQFIKIKTKNMSGQEIQKLCKYLNKNGWSRDWQCFSGKEEIELLNLHIEIEKQSRMRRPIKKNTWLKLQSIISKATK